MIPGRPPRLAQWLLTCSLPECDQQAVVGDLHEEFNARTRDQGARDARRWYWRQTLRSLSSNLLRKRRGDRSLDRAPGGTLMQSTWMDVRFGWRLMRRRPLITAVAVVSLIVGMTGATVVFGLLNAVSLRSLPVQRADELVLVLEQRESGVNHNFSYRDFTDFRSAQQSMTDLVAYAYAQPAAGFAEGSEPLRGELVTSNYFSTFGIRMRLGRALGPADDDRSAPPVVVISEGLWRRLGGAADRFEARTLALNGQTFDVVGVVAAPFRGMQVGRDARFWAPMHLQRVLEPVDGMDLTTQAVSWLTLMGRRRAAIAPVHVAQDLNRIESALPRPPNRPQPRRLIVEAGRQGDSMLPVTAAAPLQLLLGAAGLLMLVACANVAGLQMTRAAERERELTVRAALGASRGRLARLLLIEALILGTVATVITAGFSLVLTRLSVPLLDLSGGSIALDVAPDWRVWSFVASLGMCASVFFGLIPMLASSRRQPLGGALADGSRVASAGGRRALVRRGLVVTQFAVSLGLAVCAVLFIRTMHHLKTLPTGFDLDRIAVLEVDPATVSGAGAAPERVAQYVASATVALSNVPGVRAVGFARVLPLDFGGMRSTITVPGYTPAPDEDMEINLNRVTGGYFPAMGLSPTDGRLFDDRDNRGAPAAAIVNDTMARRYWPGRRAVDQTFMLGERALTIVGVVPDMKYRQLRETSEPSFYLAASQGNLTGGAFHVQTSGPAERQVETLRRAVAAVDPRVPVVRAIAMRAQADLHASKERLAMTIALVLACSAVLLAAVGLYGAMAHAVGLRTREIGVRVALGAVPADVHGLVLRQGLVLAAIGGALGVALALWLGGLIEHLLFGVRPADALSLAGATAALALIALVASWVPARRAAKIDPVIALRD